MDSPYTVEYAHGSSVYLTIPASQRNGSQTIHYLSPGQYEVIASYQGAETLTVQLMLSGSTAGNIITTPSPSPRPYAEQADPVTVIVKEGTNAGLRVFSNPNTSNLTDKTGVGSLMIIPLPRYGDE